MSIITVISLACAFLAPQDGPPQLEEIHLQVSIQRSIGASGSLILRGEPFDLVVELSNARAGRRLVQQEKARKEAIREVARLRRQGDSVAASQIIVPAAASREGDFLTPEDYVSIPRNGDWADYIKLEVFLLSDTGDPVPILNAQTARSDLRTNSLESKVGLTRARAAVAYPPSYTHSLPQGTYEVRARYDTQATADVDAWRGVVVAKSLTLIVRDAERPIESLQVALVAAKYHQARGNLAAALLQARQAVQVIDDGAEPIHFIYVGSSVLALAEILDESGAYLEARNYYERYLTELQLGEPGRAEITARISRLSASLQEDG